MYTPEDDAYIRPIEEQIKDEQCITCGSDLSGALVPTYTNIKCCGQVFSLDDNFADSTNMDSGAMKDIEVYLLY
jgi:hypothetical protein